MTSSIVYLPKKRRYLPLVEESPPDTHSNPSPADSFTTLTPSPDTKSSSSSKSLPTSYNIVDTNFPSPPKSCPNSSSPGHSPDSASQIFHPNGFQFFTRAATFNENSTQLDLSSLKQAPSLIVNNVDFKFESNHQKFGNIDDAQMECKYLRKDQETAYDETNIKSELFLPLDLTVTSSSDRDCSSTLSSIGDCSTSNSMEVNSTSNDLSDQQLVHVDHSSFSQTSQNKRETNELKSMKKHIDKYIQQNQDFQNFRNKILGHLPSFSNSNMKRYKNHPYEIVDENYLKKREKNNLSAQKCREKRNIQEKTNVCLSHYLIVENMKLVRHNQYLMETNSQLKLQFNMIQNFIQFGKSN